MESEKHAQNFNDMNPVDKNIQLILDAIKKGLMFRDFFVQGMPALHYCVSLCEEELCIRIVKEATDLDITEPGHSGYTALHYAISFGLNDLANSLIDAKADLDARTDDLRCVGTYQSGGRTPLHIAAEKGDDEMIQLLVKNGGNIHALDFDNNTPLILAHFNRLNNLKSTTLKLLQTSSSPIIDDIWISTKKKNDQKAAAKRAKLRMNPSGKFLKAYEIHNILTLQECKWILDNVCAVGEMQGWKSSRHAQYATTDIPSSDVQNTDRWLRQKIRTAVFPHFHKKYLSGLLSQYVMTYRDLFFVKYDANAQSKLELHRDGSLLSFNILLNSPDDFDGGGTYIKTLNKIHYISQGSVFLHSGQLEHAGVSITRGHRFVLVGFIDVKEVCNTITTTTTTTTTDTTDTTTTTTTTATTTTTTTTTTEGIAS